MKRKSLLLTFLLALIPGAGPMYLGYMKRGVSQMGLFMGVWGVALMLRFEWLLFVMPIIYAYSFFDTFNLRNQTPEQAAQNPDEVMAFIKYGMDALTSDSGVRRLKPHAAGLLGWGCIAVGAYLMYDIVLGGFVNRILQYYEMWWLGDLLYSLPTLAVAVALVLLGLYLLRGKKAENTAVPAPKDEYVPYKGVDDHDA